MQSQTPILLHFNLNFSFSPLNCIAKWYKFEVHFTIFKQYIWGWTHHMGWPLRGEGIKRNIYFRKFYI